MIGALSAKRRSQQRLQIRLGANAQRISCPVDAVSARETTTTNSKSPQRHLYHHRIVATAPVASAPRLLRTTGLPSSSTTLASAEAAAARQRAMMSDIEPQYLFPIEHDGAIVGRRLATSRELGGEEDLRHNGVVRGEMEDKDWQRAALNDLRAVAEGLRSVAGSSNEAVHTLVRSAWQGLASRPTGHLPESMKITAHNYADNDDGHSPTSTTRRTKSSPLFVGGALSVLEDTLRVREASARLQQLTARGENQNQINLLSAGSSAIRHYNHHQNGAANALAVQNEIAALQLAVDSVVTLWEASEKLMEPEKYGVPSSTLQLRKDERGISSSSSSSSLIGERIRLGLSAAIAALSSGSPDADLVARIVRRLRSDCCEAERLVAKSNQSQQTNDKRTPICSSSNPPPPPPRYFRQSLLRICQTCPSAALPTLTTAVSKAILPVDDKDDTCNWAKESSERGRGVASSSSLLPVSSSPSRVIGAEDLADVNVCLSALRVAIGGGTAATTTETSPNTETSTNTTAKGAGGHLAHSAWLHSNSGPIPLALKTSVNLFRCHITGRVSDLRRFSERNFSEKGKEVRGEIRFFGEMEVPPGTDLVAAASLPTSATEMIEHFIGIAERLGSFSTLEKLHSTLVAVLPELLTPPSSRFLSLYNDAELSGESEHSSEGEGEQDADANHSKAQRIAAGREAIASIILKIESPTKTNPANEIRKAEEHEAEVPAAQLLVTYYCMLLKAISSIAKQNAEAVVVATTLVIANDENSNQVGIKSQKGKGASVPQTPLRSERNISATASLLSADAIDVLAVVLEVEKPTAPSGSSAFTSAPATQRGPQLTLLAQRARGAISQSVAALARTCPERVLELYEKREVKESAAVVEAYASNGMYDEAITVLRRIGSSRADGWPAPPPEILAAAQRLALGLGQSGSPKHVATFTAAIFTFQSQHMWLGVFLDYVTVGLAERVKRNSTLCEKVIEKGIALKLNSTPIAINRNENNDDRIETNTRESRHLVGASSLKALRYGSDEARAELARDIEAEVIAVRDMALAVALQRSADISADPLLELLQECCWHPRGALLLVQSIVEQHNHLFAAYPRTYQYRSVDPESLPKTHKSRSPRTNISNEGVTETTIVMRLVGSFLEHSVLTFLRDNKQKKLLWELAAAWRIDEGEVSRLLTSEKDIAPSAQLWECRSCKRLNNSRYMYCSCTALRFSSVVCPSCGLSQAETNCKCAACRTPLLDVPEDFVVPRVPWSCSGCGAANTAYQTNFCGKCKTATGPLASAIVKKETCGSCQGVNELGFGLYPMCIDCGSPSSWFNKKALAPADAAESESQKPKVWCCDSCGQWSPTSLTRCPHCPHVELRGASALRDVAPIMCSSCGVVNTNSLASHCGACDNVLRAHVPTQVSLCTECFTANPKGAINCSSCDATFFLSSSKNPAKSVDKSNGGTNPTTAVNHIVVKSYFRFCKKCGCGVSPYNLSCVCDRCDAFLPFFTTATGDPVSDAAPDAVGIVSTCEVILRRLEKEPEEVMIDIAEGFLMELTAASEETIAISRPLLTDVIVHFGHLFRLSSLVGCRGLALTLALAHYCRCEVTEGRLVEIDRRVVGAFNRQREHDAARTASPILEELSPIASFVAGSSSAATAHNTMSMMYASSVCDTTPAEANKIDAKDKQTEDDKYFGQHTTQQEQLCSKCLSPHPESMCRFNADGWECSGCGARLSNNNGLDAVLCPSCYQVRPELEECFEVWQCPTCSRCSPETELFCLFCETHKETAARTRPEGVFVLPFLPVVCGRCSRPHLEAHCPYCTAIPPTRVCNGIGTVTIITDRFVFLQPMGTSAPEERVFVPIQLAGDLFIDQQVVFDAEEGKPGQLKATRVSLYEDE